MGKTPAQALLFSAASVRVCGACPTRKALLREEPPDNDSKVVGGGVAGRSYALRFCSFERETQSYTVRHKSHNCESMFPKAPALSQDARSQALSYHIQF